MITLTQRQTQENKINKLIDLVLELEKKDKLTTVRFSKLIILLTNKLTELLSIEIDEEFEFIEMDRIGKQNAIEDMEEKEVKTIVLFKDKFRLKKYMENINFTKKNNEKLIEDIKENFKNGIHKKIYFNLDIFYTIYKDGYLSINSISNKSCVEIPNFLKTYNTLNEMK